MSAVKKAVKKVGKFIKKHWKKIVIAVAVVFTAGLAAVGTTAFSGVSGFSGFMSAAGQTLVAGGQAILGTVGIGSGVNVGGAGSALSTFKGATLLNGSMAQTIGLATKGGAAAAGANVGSAVGIYSGPGSSMIGGGGSLFGGGTTSAQASAASAAAGSMGPPSSLAGATKEAALAGAGGASAGGGGSAAGGLGRQALIAALPGAISAYAQGRAAEEQAEANKPQQFWGVDLNTGENHFQSLADQQSAPSNPMQAKPIVGQGLAAIRAKRDQGTYRLRMDNAAVA